MLLICFSLNILLNFLLLVDLHPLYFVIVLFALNVVVALQVIIEVDVFGEGDTVVDLDAGPGCVVECKPIKDNCEQLGPLRQLYSFLCVLLAVTLTAVVLVATSKHFGLNVILKSHLHR